MDEFSKARRGERASALLPATCLLMSAMLQAPSNDLAQRGLWKSSAHWNQRLPFSPMPPSHLPPPTSSFGEGGRGDDADTNSTSGIAPNLLAR